MYYKKIILTRHARTRLWRIGGEDIRHLIKTGKVIRAVKKEGEVGTIKSKFGKKDVFIGFTIRKSVMYIITLKTR